MKVKIEAPKISGVLTEFTADPSLIRTKDEYSAGVMSDLAIEGLEAEKVSFDKFAFRNVTVTESTLAGIELTDVRFEKCDLSNVSMTDSFLHRTEFVQCRLIGTDFAGSRFRNVRFTDCVGEYASLRHGDFKQAAFVSGTWNGADFAECVLQQTVFEACRLDRASFAGSKLAGIDLSDCEFDGLIVEIGDLQGCVIAPHQASSFVGLLGLIIK